MKLRHIINLDTISTLVIVIVTIYFIIKNYRSGVKYDFLGLGESGWDPYDLDYRPSVKRKKKKRVNKHEEKCRTIFQEIFGLKFKSVRPKWLLNPTTGKNLELDGFNKTIKTSLGRGLAFEYDGIQHSEYNKHFHKGDINEFKYQLKKDEWKDFRCREEGVLLIRIPHFVAYQELGKYIRAKLRKSNVSPSFGGMYS